MHEYLENKFSTENIYNFSQIMSISFCRVTDL